MLEIRQSCENCGKPLPNESSEAMICTYECTYCTDCVENVLYNVCPNCGGGFEKRPTRPKRLLAVHPVRQDLVSHPVTVNKYYKRYKDLDPRQR
ncbi:DUF1272 domain-containing protein [Mucilaginibacter sp. SG564]|uniref:DUF1272 domain-containing protein n=1 Tax=Mucilaginibacter sp. SG564 TaxID=2587022 RepID=UPI001557FF1C|nr:hypothetical protein [Mucilaginibacter sp. SG564]